MSPTGANSPEALAEARAAVEALEAAARYETHTPFPKMVYHPSGAGRIVQSQQEQDDLGPEWRETP